MMTHKSATLELSAQLANISSVSLSIFLSAVRLITVPQSSAIVYSFYMAREGPGKFILDLWHLVDHLRLMSDFLPPGRDSFNSEE